MGVVQRMEKVRAGMRSSIVEMYEVPVSAHF